MPGAIEVPGCGVITEWRDEDSSCVEVRSEKKQTLPGGCTHGRAASASSDDSLVRQLYGASERLLNVIAIVAEVNNMLLKQIEAAGLRVAGNSGDDQLVEDH